MTIIMSAINMRGGVGKTTLTVNVGYELANLYGKRVGLLDFDSQRTTTIYLGLEAKPGEPTAYAFMTEPTEANTRGAMRVYRGTAMYPVTFPDNGCLHVLPGARTITKAYKQFTVSQSRQPAGSFNAAIAYAVQTYLNDYDVVICDPSPSSDEMTEAVTNAAHYVIAPCGAEPLSIKGLPDLLSDLRALNDARADLLTTVAQQSAKIHLPREVKLAGILATKVMSEGQRKVATALWQELDSVGINHFNRTMIPFTDAGWAAPDECVPIGVLAPQDPAAVSYRSIATQIAQITGLAA